MSIKRMLMLASMALAAIAFAAPAAQGNVVLTNGSTGEPLQAEDLVTAESTNLITTTEIAALECGHVKLSYEVVTNGSEHVVLDPVAAHNAAVENCVTNVHGIGFGTQFNEITNAGAGQLTINTEGTGEATATFTSNTPALGSHCSYHGDIPVQAIDGTDVLEVETGNKLTAPGCNDGKMHGDFTVTTPHNEGKAPVIIHFNDE